MKVVKEEEEDKIKFDQMINLVNEAKNNIDYKIFSNIFDSLNWLTKDNNSNNGDEKINVLITGSLYLVGLSLKVLEYKID